MHNYRRGASIGAIADGQSLHWQTVKRTLDFWHEPIRKDMGRAKCTRCGMILEETGCVGHAAEPASAQGRCWMCECEMRAVGFDNSNGLCYDVGSLG